MQSPVKTNCHLLPFSGPENAVQNLQVFDEFLQTLKDFYGSYSLGEGSMK